MPAASDVVGEGLGEHMNAGAGAEEQSRRHGTRIADLEAQLEAERRRQAAWEAGAEGERRVGAALEVLGPEWRTVHDVHWPGRPKANLDHVAVGPTGVWVVDAKNWTGRVTTTDGMLCQNGYRRNECAEAAERAAAAVAALLEPRHRMLVRPVICLAGSGADLAAVPSTSSMTVVGLQNLSGLLSAREERLSPAEVITIGRYLARHLGGATSPAQLTSAVVPAPGEAVLREMTGSATQPRVSRGGSTRAARRQPRSGTPRASKRSAAGRPTRGLFAGCLVVMLKVVAIIVAFWLFAGLLMVLMPHLVELVTSSLVPAMTPDLTTPTPGPTP
ncbi:nuclease-related domain-containing protein [Aquipuribacter sp. MA13-6]|uniref:nuclease-related domain-containing protein n=1 Tax=unclassified Aquipuribacter TaxID=2635084 RepID=UPI003EE9E4D9